MSLSPLAFTHNPRMPSVAEGRPKRKSGVPSPGWPNRDSLTVKFRSGGSAAAAIGEAIETSRQTTQVLGIFLISYTKFPKKASN